MTRHRVQSKIRAWGLGVMLAIAMAGSAAALESDQHTTPPTKLADLGPRMSAIVWETLLEIINETNTELAQLDTLDTACPGGPGSRWRERRRQRLLDESQLVREIYGRLGMGFPKTRIEHRLEREAEAIGANGSFRPAFDESVYRSTGWLRPLNVVGIVPTVNMYGTHMGADKLGHIFQQGREYLVVYLRALRKSKTPAEALRRAVKHGVEQEKGVYGNLPSGVYSNADLAANYAGLQFYLSLTESVEVNGLTLPALFEVKNNRWHLAPRAGERAGQALLAPFLSEHLNEAMNPGRFDWTMRDAIRENITELAPAWLARRYTTRSRELARKQRVASWHGAPYGHSGYRDVITVADVVDWSKSTAVTRR